MTVYYIVNMIGVILCISTVSYVLGLAVLGFFKRWSLVEKLSLSDEYIVEFFLFTVCICAATEGLLGIPSTHYIFAGIMVVGLGMLFTVGMFMVITFVVCSFIRSKIPEEHHD